MESPAFHFNNRTVNIYNILCISLQAYLVSRYRVGKSRDLLMTKTTSGRLWFVYLSNNNNMPYCFAFGCNYESGRSKCKLYRFPVDASKRRKWKCFKIAHSRVHVERANECIKNYNILDHIPAKYRSLSTKICQVCECLVNLQSPLPAEITDSYAVLGNHSAWMTH